MCLYVSELCLYCYRVPGIIVMNTVVVSATIPLRSPRKSIIFTIKKYIYRIEVSKKIYKFVKKKTSLMMKRTLVREVPKESRARVQRTGSLDHAIGHPAITPQPLVHAILYLPLQLSAGLHVRRR